MAKRKSTALAIAGQIRTPQVLPATRDESTIVAPDGRRISVTKEIRDAESIGRKGVQNLGSAFREFGKSILAVAHEVVPAFNRWIEATGIKKGAVDLYLQRVDADYVPGQVRDAGTHSMAMRNRWNNMMAAYNADVARQKLAVIADTDDEAARQELIDALTTEEKRAIASLSNKRGTAELPPAIVEARQQVIGVQTDTEDDEDALPDLTPAEFRNGLVRSIMAVVPAEMHGRIMDMVVQRGKLSGAGLTRFQRDVLSVDPWLKCAAPADGVQVIAPKSRAEKTAVITNGRKAKAAAAKRTGTHG